LMEMGINNILILIHNHIHITYFDTENINVTAARKDILIQDCPVHLKVGWF